MTRHHTGGTSNDDDAQSRRIVLGVLSEADPVDRERLTRLLGPPVDWPTLPGDRLDAAAYDLVMWGVRRLLPCLDPADAQIIRSVLVQLSIAKSHLEGTPRIGGDEGA